MRDEGGPCVGVGIFFESAAPLYYACTAVGRALRPRPFHRRCAAVPLPR